MFNRDWFRNIWHRVANDIYQGFVAMRKFGLEDRTDLRVVQIDFGPQSFENLYSSLIGARSDWLQKWPGASMSSVGVCVVVVVVASDSVIGSVTAFCVLQRCVVYGVVALARHFSRHESKRVDAQPVGRGVQLVGAEAVRPSCAFDGIAACL